MGDQSIAEYQRTFLSPNYMENFKFNDEGFEERKKREARENKRKAEDMAALRDRDIQKWENVRRSIAPLMKVQYSPGYWVAGARGDQGGSPDARWVDGIPSDWAVAECMEPLIPGQGLITSPITGQTALPNAYLRRKAFMENGKYLENVSVYYKLDQDFESYATPWELKWSDLSAPYNRGFTPVLDRSYTVVGHWGEVLGGPTPLSGNFAILVAPESFNGSLQEALDKGIPVFVSSVGGVTEGWRAQTWFTTEHKVEVKTGPDGQVMTYQLTSTGGLEQPWYSPMDLYYIGKAVFSLAKVGAKLTVSLLSKKAAGFEARVLLNGPTKALAKEAAQKEATLASKTQVGMAVTHAGALPAEHMASRTIIMGEDMAKIRAALSSSRPEKGLYDVVIHGDSTSFHILVKSGGKEVWREVSVKEVAEIIRPHLAPGDSIRLLACEVGGTGGPAQQLATELKRTVWASTTTVNAVADTVGSAGRKVFVPLKGGAFHEFLP